MSIPIKDFTRQKADGVTNIVQALKQYGVVLMPSYLDSGTVEDLTGDFYAILDANEKWVAKRMNSKTDKQVAVERDGLSKSGQFSTLNKVYSDPFMQQITDGYLGQPNHFNREIMVHHSFESPNKGITETHYDRISTLKFFIYLTDTTAENGAFACVPASQHVAQTNRDFYLKRGVRVVDMPNFSIPEGTGDPLPMEGPAGTMVIFTTDTYHRGGFVGVGKERLIMRGHSYPGKYVEDYKPAKYTPQWWRESRYNPMRYFYKVTDALTGAKAPEGRIQTANMD